ncbi:transposable element Tcb1 transposase [Trichonephila clavipes]|nr:transposable element Tcb1 transposase [Trichonephila clavipes]
MIARLEGGGIVGSKTDQLVQIGAMTGQIYLDVILEQHVRLFRGVMDAEFVFMDDTTHPHRVNIVIKCLQTEDMTLITSILTGLDSSRACVGHTWSTSLATSSYMSTGTLESIS